MCPAARRLRDLRPSFRTHEKVCHSLVCSHNSLDDLQGLVIIDCPSFSFRTNVVLVLGAKVCVTRVCARSEIAAPSFRSHGMLRAEVPEHARDQGDGPRRRVLAGPIAKTVGLRRHDRGDRRGDSNLQSVPSTAVPLAASLSVMMHPSREAAIYS
jgi:hypothetical protein